jgi:hypothetical protein
MAIVFAPAGAIYLLHSAWLYAMTFGRLDHHSELIDKLRWVEEKINR